ncbi:MAG: hypothetical protein IK095_00080 [Oscillospiraceae bacterium]|nr:hypothetical protein [Oscillospiraceae bacterium]
MAGKTMTAERIREAWSRASGGWRCEAAEAFHREFVLTMEETAEAFDRDCAQVTQGAAALREKLENFARSLDT